MSYILDALKKSDQERKHGEVPGLDSFQDQPKPPAATSRILLYSLIGVLLTNTLAVALWVTFRQDTESSIEEVVSLEDSRSTDAPGLAAVKIPTAKIVAEKTDSPTETEPAVESTMGPTEQALTTDILPDDLEDEPPGDNIPIPTLTSFAKLPADIREDLPKLTIAAHYYAGKESSRMASINGRIMRQGQTISDGLVLEEITREGVIFNFRDYRFTLDVFIR